jgi:hypothetical protein
MRTDAAMIRMAPIASSSLSGRRRAGRSWLGFGQAMMNSMNGPMPIGALQRSARG